VGKCGAEVDGVHNVDHAKRDLNSAFCWPHQATFECLLVGLGELLQDPLTHQPFLP